MNDLDRGDLRRAADLRDGEQPAVTTIAYRDGVLAADSQVTAGDIYRGNARKVFAVNTSVGRTLVAASGSRGAAEAFRTWIREGGEKPEIHKDDTLLGIVVRPDGTVEVWNERLAKQPVVAPFVAAGSGNEIAMGAMGAGASAEEAVKIACRFCIYSSEPVHTVRLGD